MLAISRQLLYFVVILFIIGLWVEITYLSWSLYSYESVAVCEFSQQNLQISLTRAVFCDSPRPLVDRDTISCRSRTAFIIRIVRG